MIRFVLFFDIPYDINADHLYFLIGAIDSLSREKTGLGLMGQIYFTTPEQQDVIFAGTMTQTEKIDYNSQGYYPLEIYKILSMYFPQIASNNVFDFRFIQLAWSKEKTITEILEDVEKLMLKSLDCEKETVPYLLKPLEK